MSDYQIIEASPFEWGLLYKDKGVKTWFKNSLGKEPTLEHPEMQQAIKNNEGLMKDFPGIFDEVKSERA